MMKAVRLLEFGGPDKLRYGDYPLPDVGPADVALRPGGTFCLVGGELREIPLRVIDMVSKELNIHGIRGATRNDQRVVMELLEKERIRMPIHALLPLAKVAEAHAMLESSEDLVGRIVLHPWDEV